MRRISTATGLVLTALAGWCTRGRSRRLLRRAVPAAPATVRVPAPTPAAPAPPLAPPPPNSAVTAVYIGSDLPLPRRVPDAGRTGLSLTGLPRQRSAGAEPVPVPRVPAELALRPTRSQPLLHVPRQRRR
jgi:hypothetical protein